VISQKKDVKCADTIIVRQADRQTAEIHESFEK